MAQLVNYPPIAHPITIVETPDQPWAQFNPSGLVSRVWENFFRWLQALINVAPQVIGTVALTAQGASIAATVIATTFPSQPNTQLLPGLYRIATYARITRAGSVSSSLTVSIRHVDGAVTITQAGAAMTGNTTATVQSNTYLVRVDSQSAISYITAYADGGGATSMTYSLNIRVEAIPEPA